MPPKSGKHGSDKNMKKVTVTEEVALKGSYDVLVAGGGVAGVAAAVAAARRG